MFKDGQWRPGRVAEDWSLLGVTAPAWVRQVGETKMLEVSRFAEPPIDEDWTLFALWGDEDRRVRLSRCLCPRRHHVPRHVRAGSPPLGHRLRARGPRTRGLRTRRLRMRGLRTRAPLRLAATRVCALAALARAQAALAALDAGEALLPRPLPGSRGRSSRRSSRPAAAAEGLEYEVGRSLLAGRSAGGAPSRPGILARPRVAGGVAPGCGTDAPQRLLLWV